MFILDKHVNTCYNKTIERREEQMNESISEIIKDLSEAFLAIVTAICLIVKTKQESKSKRSKRKKK